MSTDESNDTSAEEPLPEEDVEDEADPSVEDPQLEEDAEEDPSDDSVMSAIKKEDGFSISAVQETIRDVLKNLQGQFDSDDARDRYEQGKYSGPIVLASDPKVVDEAVEKIVDVRQQLKAREVGIEDEDKISKIEVDLDVPEDYRRLLKEFDNILAEVRQPIVEELERRQSGAEKNPMVDDEEPIMTYVIEKNAGTYGDATLLGGSKAIIFNLTEQYGFTDDERELIRKAHGIAADKNGFERHTLVEDLAVIPQFQHDDVDPTVGNAGVNAEGSEE